MAVLYIEGNRFFETGCYLAEKFTARRPGCANYAVLQEWESKPYFLKIHAANATAEFNRGAALNRASLETGLFLAPRPLHLISDCGIIVWEYLEQIVPIRAHIARSVEQSPGASGARTNFFETLGRSLFAVQEALGTAGPAVKALPFETIDSPDGGLNQHVARVLHSAPILPAHGDFSCLNVYVTSEKSAAKNSGEIIPVILDPTMNKYLYPKWRELTNVASPIYFDCAEFIYSLFFKRTFHALVRNEIDDYAEKFFHGYESSSGEKLDRATVWSCAAEIANRYRTFWRQRNPGRMQHLLDWREERFRRAMQRSMYERAIAALPVPIGGKV